MVMIFQHFIHQYRISEKKTTPHATMGIHHSLFEHEVSKNP
jgi:hypothetical protein